jgi:hypothetical protein
MVAQTSAGAITSDLQAMDVADPVQRLEITLKAAVRTLKTASACGNASSANSAIGQIRGTLKDLAAAKIESGSSHGCPECRRRIGKSLQELQDNDPDHWDLICTCLGLLRPNTFRELSEHKRAMPEPMRRELLIELRDFFSAVIDDPQNWSSEKDFENPNGRADVMPLTRRFRVTTLPGTPYPCARVE